MRFPARACAGMAGMVGGVIVQFKRNQRELCLNRRLYAFGAGKMRFLLCQFLVRLTVGAHTGRSMSDAFEYRPKFVDIRVKKPDAETKPRGRAEQPCDHVGCERVGRHMAPKGRDHEGQFWHFCREHVAAYNKRWNYFSGMSDSEWADYQAREEVGHRPTWTFRGGRLDRFSAAMRGFAGGDPFSMFGSRDPAGTAQAAPRRRLTRLQAKAFEALSLEEGAGAEAIRARYAELVKRWHPDSNGGDRGAEESLQRVLNAYQTLKAGGLV